MYKIQQGDCLELMVSIPNKSIDMILADLPYGTTACSWDTIIPFEPLWENYKRIVKSNGCIALFGSEPFSSHLRLSNIKQYKYDWIWEKEQGSNPLNAKFQPIKIHEHIHIFSDSASTYSVNGVMQYYPIMVKGKPYAYNSKKDGNHTFHSSLNHKKYINNEGTRFPKTVLKFNTERGFHATQKPVSLLEYLILTYTNENQTVLDNTMGSGSTGVACIRTNRNFIGYEKDSNYFSIAEKRILEEIDKTSLFNSLGGAARTNQCMNVA